MPDSPTEQLADEIASAIYAALQDGGHDTADYDFPVAKQAALQVLTDPSPAGLVDRIRITLAAATSRLVYGNSEQLERAAAEMQREDELVEQHAAALRRAIGPALRNAEVWGTGWIRIDATVVAQSGGDVYDWTISSPAPTTIAVQP